MTAGPTPCENIAVGALSRSHPSPLPAISRSSREVTFSTVTVNRVADLFDSQSLMSETSTVSPVPAEFPLSVNLYSASLHPTNWFEAMVFQLAQFSARRLVTSAFPQPSSAAVARTENQPTVRTEL